MNNKVKDDEIEDDYDFDFSNDEEGDQLNKRIVERIKEDTLVKNGIANHKIVDSNLAYTDSLRNASKQVIMEKNRYTDVNLKS